MLHNFRCSGAIDAGVLRSPCAQTIYIAVAHAKYRGDENRVVNFSIGRSLLAGSRYVFLCYLLSALLHSACDV